MQKIDQKHRCVLPFHAKQDGRLVQDTWFAFRFQKNRVHPRTKHPGEGIYSQAVSQIEVLEFLAPFLSHLQEMESLIVVDRGDDRVGILGKVRWFLHPHLDQGSRFRERLISPVPSTVFPSM